LANAETFLTFYHGLLEVAQAELEAAAGMQQRCGSPANSVGTEDDRKRRCIRPRWHRRWTNTPTRTDFDGVDSWQVPDTGVVPE